MAYESSLERDPSLRLQYGYARDDASTRPKLSWSVCASLKTRYSGLATN